MQLLFCLLVVLGAVGARRIKFNDRNMPIRSVDTSYGQSNHERVDYLEAVILPRHVNNNGRINFPHSGLVEEYYQRGRADGDERGHLVGSQFSGPAEWYNLSPQNARVNRNKDFQAITTDWYGTECEVRKFLNKGGNRQVNWRVRMKYIRDSNRPHEYHLQVDFFENGKNNNRGISAVINNPFEKQDSNFWICRSCRGNHNDQCSRQ